MIAAMRLHDLVASGDFSRRIFATVEGVSLSDAVRVRVSTFAARRVAGLGELTATISPVCRVDFYRALAAFWLELRFEWQRHNLVSNYHTIRTGECHMAAFVLAAASSCVLACIEEHLEAVDRALMDEFAAELIGGTHDALTARFQQAQARASHVA
jgi:hypothetical protein